MKSGKPPLGAAPVAPSGIDQTPTSPLIDSPASADVARTVARAEPVNVPEQPPAPLPRRERASDLTMAAGASLSTPDEIEECIEEVRVTGRGTVRMDEILPDGSTRGIARYPAAQFDLYDWMQTMGEGRYRILCGERNVPGCRSQRWFYVSDKAAKRPTAAVTAPAAPSMASAHQAPPPQPAMQQPMHLPYPFVYPSSPPPAAPLPQSAAAPLDATLLITTMLKQQGDLLVALLTQRAEREVTQTPVSQLSELLKVAQQIAKIKGSGDAGGEADGFGPLAGLGSALLQALTRQPSPQTPTASPQPLRQLTPTPTPPRLVTLHPTRPVANAPDTAQAAAAGTPDERATPTGPAPTATERAGAVRAAADPRVSAVLEMLRGSAADEERDPISFANVVASIIGDGTLGQVLNSTQAPFLAEQLLQLAPDLAEQRKFVDALEGELRAMFQDEDPTAGNGDDAGTTAANGDGRSRSAELTPA